MSIAMGPVPSSAVATVTWHVVAASRRPPSIGWDRLRARRIIGRREGKETGHVHAEVIIRFWREEDKMKRRRHGAAEEEEERPSLIFSFHGQKVKGQDGERGRRSQRDRSCC